MRALVFLGALVLASSFASCKVLNEILGIEGETSNPIPTPGGGNSVEVAFNKVMANGGPVDGGVVYPTTALTLHFSAGIAGLSADDITLTSPDGADIGIKGELTGEGPSYTLYVEGITADGDVSVSVAKAGYAVSGNPQKVWVYAGSGSPPPTQEPVVFSGLSANGAGDAATQFLTLAFNTAVELTDGNVYLNPGSTDAKAGSLSPSGVSSASYTLAVGGWMGGWVTKAGDVSVTVTKAGCAFTPPTKTVTVLDGKGPAPQPPFPRQRHRCRL